MPSAPYSPIPQEKTSPFSQTTAECPHPHEILIGREGSSASTSQGQELNLAVRSLIPSRPSMLLPIAYMEPLPAMNTVCSSPQEIAWISTLNEQKRGRGCVSNVVPFSLSPSYPKWSSPQANTSVYSVVIFNDLFFKILEGFFFGFE